MTDTDRDTKSSSDDYSMVLQPLLDIPKVRHTVVASSDGMLVAASKDLPRDRAEGVAAMSSSVLSANRATTNEALQADPDHPVDNPVETITAITALGTLMFMPAGKNAFLVVVGERDMPMGIVAGTAARQARKLGEKLMSVPARATSSTQS
ncbi:roadblock/LC7 domain-containing protein [Streptomyces sp. NPDC102441]|uniref:roadblock/LC7 domain-containing protein n=1 Tax=Streptomyces sp. NPDC102441 TaxID=3366176 RepID=UPI003828955D